MSIPDGNQSIFSENNLHEAIVLSSLHRMSHLTVWFELFYLKMWQNYVCERTAAGDGRSWLWIKHSMDGNLGYEEKSCNGQSCKTLMMVSSLSEGKEDKKIK